MKSFFVFAAALAVTFSPVRAEDQEFIRVDEDATAARLQTAVTRFEKDGAVVDLIGAVHIADQAYYEDLNKRFAGYEVLLFEMVGGENIKPGVVDPKPDPKAKKNPLHLIYNKAAEMLDLTGQVEHIDYHAGNFIHADLTAAEFAEKQQERGESLWKFLLEISRSAKVADAANQPRPLQLIFALVSGRADLLKLSLIHTLGQGDDQIASLSGETVIIGDRNARCLDVMASQLVEGRKRIGIFYGAAHFPDMQKRLLEQGFNRTGHEWLTAWNVAKPAKKQTVPTP